MKGEPFCVIEGDNPNQIYRGTIKGLQDKGNIVVSRGLETKEIHPALVIFNNPRERFLTCPKRKIHPFFQVMESIWILSGRGDVAWIAKYLKNITKYSDEKEYFHAPYGWRMRQWNRYREINYDLQINSRDQFKDCYEYLKDSPDTRHAVMTFWNPCFDNYNVKTIDRPCNITFHFLVRDNALDLTIFNRSNDAHWGLFNANVVQFSVILETMAHLLGYNVGRQIHMIDSLHYYTDNPLTEQVLSFPKEFDIYQYVLPRKFFMDYPSFDIGALDNSLVRFFNYEKRIWNGDKLCSDHTTGFNYLDDALHLASSFFEYKVNGSIHLAIQELAQVKADDIYVSCLEFLTRDLCDPKYIENIVFRRFKDKLTETPKKEILSYVLGH